MNDFSKFEKISRISTALPFIQQRKLVDFMNSNQQMKCFHYVNAMIPETIEVF